jgi:hypothetical protein
MFTPSLGPAKPPICWVKGKGKFRLMKARTGSRGIALFSDHGTGWGWVVNYTPRPLYPLERDTVPIVQEAGWAHGLSGGVRKISPRPGFGPRTVQPVPSSYTHYAIPTHLFIEDGR